MFESPSRWLSIPLDEAASARRAEAGAQPFGALASVSPYADSVPRGAFPVILDDEWLVSPQNRGVLLLQLIIGGECIGLRSVPDELHGPHGLGFTRGGQCRGVALCKKRRDLRTRHTIGKHHVQCARLGGRPFFRGAAGHDADISLRLPRQAPVPCEPILNPFGASIIGGRGKAEVAKLRSQISQ